MLDVDLAHPLRTFALEVSFTVPAGRCLALAGPSGAGKTTVLRAIAGLVRAHAGHVRCGGETWQDGDGAWTAPEERRCGVVFQDYALFGHLRAWQNVAYGLRGRDRRGRAVAELERFGAGHLADARPRELSGGERQRVALARALAPRPRALLLDEPLAALDVRTRDAAQRELAAVLRSAEVPAIVVSHDFAEAGLLGDEVAVLDAGRVVQRGDAATLAGRPASAFVAGFTGASVLLGEATPRAGGLTRVALEGGGTVLSTDVGSGAVGVVVRPWDVTLGAPEATAAPVSARNVLRATVVAVTPLGGRARVALALPAPLAAEVSTDAVTGLGLAPGATVLASWKATATRLVPR